VSELWAVGADANGDGPPLLELYDGRRDVDALGNQTTRVTVNGSRLYLGGTQGGRIPITREMLSAVGVQSASGVETARVTVGARGVPGTEAFEQIASNAFDDSSSGSDGGESSDGGVQGSDGVSDSASEPTEIVPPRLLPPERAADKVSELMGSFGVNWTSWTVRNRERKRAQLVDASYSAGQAETLLDRGLFSVCYPNRTWSGSLPGESDSPEGGVAPDDDSNGLSGDTGSSNHGDGSSSSGNSSESRDDSSSGTSRLAIGAGTAFLLLRVLAG
jgi:hypothetical protein